MAKVEKLLKRLKFAEDEGNHYESHQIARTIYYRWLELKEHEKLADFLFEKAVKFQKAGQSAIALDLAELYAGTLSEWGCSVDEKRVEQIAELLNSIPDELDTESGNKDRRADLFTKFIDWSCKHADSSQIIQKFGHPKIHEVIAESSQNVGRYDVAKQHFVVSISPEKLAKAVKVIIDNTDEGSESLPSDFFITATALQVAVTGRIGVATKFLLEVVSEYKNYNDHPPFRSAALNFCWLCLITLHLRSVETFTQTVEAYHPTLHQSQIIMGLVDKIGHRFFGLQPKNRNEMGGGLFGNLLKGLVSKKPESETENQSISLDFGDDPLITTYNFNLDQFHAAFQAAEALNPPQSMQDPEFSDAMEEQPEPPPPASDAQGDMDLD
ncbi:unnamed protein product [Bursaphelenchus okinawaensis]|uniref:Uncharacterized protein n=1 Tax=Bursaphelenchus okinawaensis TaxID=465554 RepID=A0A811LJU2_9BILA|nr:unnamed protein product [Bursaphelenchus okinawaensis]CAG9124564.1 unnamed protein product [Bursaphelenchus okinawaensis]